MDRLNISGEDFLNSSLYKMKDRWEMYEISEDLNNAVKVAIALNQPLLLTGEPGTGKTLLAEKVAADLHIITDGKYASKPYLFDAKSNSVYTDLFYTYDAIGHFYTANIEKQTKPELKQFIRLNALGEAIVASMKDEEKQKVPAWNLPSEETPVNSVVLIDEIDKAPRDFPNDLLRELDEYSFRIKEAGLTLYKKVPDANIFIILTSNGERDLPDAFLRRCVFFNIEFPDNGLLTKILENHALLNNLGSYSNIVLQRFQELRDICRNKRPATAELVAWCKILVQRDIDPTVTNNLLSTLSVVVKDANDLKIVKEKWASDGI